MNAEQLRSLARLLDYIAEDKQKHFEASSLEERENHIHLDIQILQDYLTQAQGETNS
jgi:hypothetical protein